MLKLVLLRHGQSIWNLKNKFTGWMDLDLSDQGISEAHQAGKLLKSEGYFFDVAFTSVLKRAIRTLWIVLAEMDLMRIPVHCSWRINERHYGALQGLNKKVMISAHGNSLRALIKHLDNISAEENIGLNIPTGIPLVYELDDDLRVKGHLFLGNEDNL